MKRIAISMITLMAGGVLSAQITPQAAQAIQTQARSAGQPAQAAASPSAAKHPEPVVTKAAPASKSVSPTAAKPSAASTKTVKPAAKNPQAAQAPMPAAASKVKPAVAAVKPATVKPVVPKAAPIATAAPKVAVQKGGKTAQPKVKEAMVKTESPAPEPKPVINLTSRRDPFTSPVSRALAVNQGPGCSTGKRCLAVDQMILRGIVRSPNGMIAVVENGAKRAYFLRENDPVWHGVVVKINGDSVTFREETVDSKTGKSATHEVVKRVNAPVV
jgi:hypothetical protein